MFKRTMLSDSETPFVGFALSKENIRVKIFDRINQLPSDWDRVAPIDNIFLQRNYLEALEKYPPKGMSFAYLLFYQDDRPIGLAINQILLFNADESLAKDEDGKSLCFFEATSLFLKKLIAKKVEFNSLILGNLLLTGAHGIYFDPNQIEAKKAFSLVEHAMNGMMDYWNSRGKQISLSLIKDYSEKEIKSTAVFKEKSFKEFCIQPNMFLRIRDDWESFDDYLAALHSKYRVRARRAFKKGKDIRKVEFTAEDIENNLDKMYELYSHVVQNAGFNAIQLHREYFLGLKLLLKDKFKLFAYYLGEELIAFYTIIYNHQEVEAHFLGVNNDYNRTYQVYLNILYDILRKGIEAKAEKVVYARTALEIKSSVGAVAEDMYCYMRHRNAISNKFTINLFEYLNPKVEWTPRHPFK